MADGLLRRKVKENNLNVFVDSAGTANYHIGKKPDHRMCQKFDHIYAMDLSNYQNILKLASNDEDVAKVKLILNELFPDENQAVPDPYYGTQKDFQEVYDLLNHATDVVISKIKNGSIR
jgi:protein-tyrosine phosphatase